MDYQAKMCLMFSKIYIYISLNSCLKISLFLIKLTVLRWLDSRTKVISLKSIIVINPYKITVNFACILIVILMYLEESIIHLPCSSHRRISDGSFKFKKKINKLKYNKINLRNKLKLQFNTKSKIKRTFF